MNKTICARFAFCLSKSSVSLALILVACAHGVAGTWTPLSNPPPAPAGHFLLLTDGSVMAENLGSGYGPTWFRLKPDIHGSYANGTWTTTAAMHYTRLDFASIVLKDGRVLVAGGEYGNGTNTAEVYDPVADTWTLTGSPPAGQRAFYDSGAVLLPNGTVLIAPVNPSTYGGTVIFDPSANTLTAGATLYRGYYQDEASWVKLPDDSILTVDPFGTNSERYIPNHSPSAAWVNDANVPVPLYGPYGGELGAALLLPNGKAIFFGGTGHTALYTPSGTTAPGSWAAGPDIPNGQGQPDAPAAMMPNGKVLLAVSPKPYAIVGVTTNVYTSPTSFYEYDYLGNSFAQVNAPGGGTTLSGATYPDLMLDLPDGSVLFGHRSTDFYLYQPGGAPVPAGKPVIAGITTNLDGSVHLAGTLFNGISQGSSYGDDEQNDSNFPIVRFIDAAGNVRYGRTYNWSSTSVMTGSAILSTDCTLPAGASLSDAIEVVANGIPSDPYGSAGNLSLVTSTADSGPGSLRQVVALQPAGATVTFAPALSGQTIRLTAGPIALNENLTIDGSALTNGIHLDGSRQSTIFTVAASVNVVLDSLTLTNGWSDSGGAIYNAGSLRLSQCTLGGNSATNGVGGAIYNTGSLLGSACTFLNNSGGFAGAIENYAFCTLVNCTLTGNTTPANGGAIDNDFSATLALTQCTFSGNSAGAGGAVDNYQSVVNVTNSILADDSGSGPDIYNWSSSSVNFGGTNIVSGIANSGTVTGSETILAVEPQIEALGNFGGVVPTMPPQPGSPAIDAGSTEAAGGIATDERGYPRVSGGGVDIGAVEVQIAGAPFRLAGAMAAGNEGFQFGFTNLVGGSFTVFAGTNAAQPFDTWSNLGAALENPPGSGSFYFMDPATNYLQRFYRVASP